VTISHSTALCALNSTLAGLDPDMLLFEAVELLQGHGLSGAPVLDAAGRPIGVLSEERCLRPLAADVYERTASARVSDAMCTPAPTVRADTPLPVVAERMAEADCCCLAVLDEDDRLVGQVNLEDLIDALLELARGHVVHEDARFISGRAHEAQQGRLAGPAKPRLSLRDAVGTQTDEVYRRALESGGLEEGAGFDEDTVPDHRRRSKDRSSRPHPKT
jgi:predicted transcriptional regulator